MNKEIWEKLKERLEKYSEDSQRAFFSIEPSRVLEWMAELETEYFWDCQRCHQIFSFGELKGHHGIPNGRWVETSDKNLQIDLIMDDVRTEDKKDDKLK